MRSAVLLLLLPALASTGCSALLTSAGQDLAKLETREDVRKQFGEPVAVGGDKDYPTETYQTRKKLSEPVRSFSMAWGAILTLGLSEIYSLPVELVRCGYRSVYGQSVQFDYDATGVIVTAHIEGYRVHGFEPEFVRQRYEQRGQTHEKAP